MSKPYRHHDSINLINPAFWNNIAGFAATGIAISIFLQENYNSGCGDFPQHYQISAYSALIGGVIGLFFNLSYARIPNAYRIQPIIVFLLRMFLAWVILGYGMAKVFAGQFPTLMANMDSRFIELTPMRVAWAFFGYSKGYQIFLGWGEVIPAILLLFRRTTLLGALIMVVVMLNVWLVNIFFDVCVKLNSFIYLAIALYIFFQHSNRLWKFFFTNQTVPPPYHENLADRKLFKRLGLIINILIIGGILSYPILEFYDYFTTTNTPQKKNEIFGAWKIAKIEKWNGTNWTIPNEADSCNYYRCYFEGYGGVIKSNLKRQRFSATLDTTKKEIAVNLINNRNTRYEERIWKYQKLDSEHLNFIGRLGRDSIRTECILRKNILYL